MTNFVLVNNASTSLAGAASLSATSLVLSSAANLPSSIPSGSVLAMTLNDAATRQIYEIVYVTAIAGTTLTVLRGQEGTAAQNWNIGDFAFCALTAGMEAALAAGNGRPVPNGQCQLQYVNGTSIKLAPNNGCAIVSGGVQYQLPSGGVTAANTGVTVNGTGGQNLAASTTYYVSYNGASGVLKYWTQGTYNHMPDTTAGNIGIEVISLAGVPQTQESLVGILTTDASANFNDNAQKRNVTNWFTVSRMDKRVAGVIPGNVTTTSTTPVELSTAWEVELTCFANNNPALTIVGSNNSTPGPSTLAIVQFGIDGVAQAVGTQASSPSSGANEGGAAMLNTDLAEGHHVISPFGSISVGGTSGTFSLQITGVMRG